MCALVALPYFSTLSSQTARFSEKIIEHKMCVLIYLQFLSVTFLILRRNERDTVINVHESSCKVPIILVSFQ